MRGFSQAVPPEKLDPGDDDRGTPDHRIKRLEGLFLAEPRDLFDLELKIGLDRPEIDVFRIPPWHRGMVIIWHVIDHARSWLTSGYDFFGSLASGLVFSDCAAFPIAKKINAMYRPMEM